MVHWQMSAVPRVCLSVRAVAAQDGNAGESRVKLRHGDVLVVDTRAGRVQLDALRRLLGQGFQAHLQHNPLLHQARPRNPCLHLIPVFVREASLANLFRMQ